MEIPQSPRVAVSLRNELQPPTSPAPLAEVNSAAAFSSGLANFCRISGTPEEVLIDFGLNPRPMEFLTEPIVVTQRIVTSWHTAKRLREAMQLAVDRQEAAFGPLETDVQRRAGGR